MLRFADNHRSFRNAEQRAREGIHDAHVVAWLQALRRLKAPAAVRWTKKTAESAFKGVE